MDCVLLFVNNWKVAHLILLNSTTANIRHVYMGRLQVDNKNMLFFLHIASSLLFFRFQMSISNAL